MKGVDETLSPFSQNETTDSADGGLTMVISVSSHGGGGETLLITHSLPPNLQRFNIKCTDMDKIVAYFDGSITINPCGDMGIGVLIMQGFNELHRHTQLFPAETWNGRTTNNVAEYMAKQYAMWWLLENGYKHHNILLLGDSTIAVNGTTKKGSCAEVAEICRELRSQFTKLRCEWIPREENLADEISR